MFFIGMSRGNKPLAFAVSSDQHLYMWSNIRNQLVPTAVCGGREVFDRIIETDTSKFTQAMIDEFNRINTYNLG